MIPDLAPWVRDMSIKREAAENLQYAHKIDIINYEHNIFHNIRRNQQSYQNKICFLFFYFMINVI